MNAIFQAEKYSMIHAARVVGVHTATIWRWYLSGVRGRKLGTVLIGGRRYVLASELDAFLTDGNRDRPLNGDDLRRRAAEAGRVLDAMGVRAATIRTASSMNAK
jgi:hypothetical protein